MVVASGTNYPDALSAGPVAWHLGGVLLLVPPTDLADGDAARQFIASHNEAIDSLVVSGGEVAISETVEQQLRLLIQDE